MTANPSPPSQPKAQAQPQAKDAKPADPQGPVQPAPKADRSAQSDHVTKIDQAAKTDGTAKVTAPVSTTPANPADKVEKAPQPDAGTGDDADDSASVELPAEMLASFLALFLAMAGQQAQAAQPTDTGDQTQVGSTDGVGGKGSVTTTLFAMVERTTTTTQQGEATSPLQKLLAALADGDPIKVLVERLIAALGGQSDEGAPPVRTEQFKAVFAEMLVQLGASQGTDLKQLVDQSPKVEGTPAAQPDVQLAQAAADLARALMATAPVSGQAADNGTQGQPDQRQLAAAIESAKAIATVAEVGQKLNLNQVHGASHVTIKLQPESLGTIHIDVERTADGVTAHVAVTTPQGRQVAEQSLDAIQGALRDAGIPVDSIRVTGPRAENAPSFDAALQDATTTTPTTNTTTQPSTAATTPSDDTTTNTNTTTTPTTGAEEAPKAKATQPTTNFVSTAQPGDDAAQAQQAPKDAPAPVQVDAPQPVAKPSTTEQVKAAEQVSGAEEAQAPREAKGRTVSDDPTPVAKNTMPQTVRVDGPVAAEAPAPARDAALQLARDVAEQAGVLAGQGKSEFRIQLRPESLGHLQIRLTLEDGAVTVRMTAESAQAKSALESNLGQLKQAFQDQGVRVDRFMVLLGQGQFGQENGHPRRSRGWVDEVRSVRGRSGGEEFSQALASAVNYLA